MDTATDTRLAAEIAWRDRLIRAVQDEAASNGSPISRAEAARRVRVYQANGMLPFAPAPREVRR